MYDASSITALSRTIGFGKSIQESINLDASNEIGSSGMVFASFHKLVTVDNLLSTFDKIISDNDALINSNLTQIRLDAAKKVLAEVLDNSIQFDDSVDYTEIIVTKLNLLRGPFGLAVCIASLEMMISSGRFNIGERSIRESFATLKLELEGAKSDSGRIISYGIISKFNFAVKKCQKVIFQIRPIVTSENVW